MSYADVVELLRAREFEMRAAGNENAVVVADGEGTGGGSGPTMTVTTTLVKREEGGIVIFEEVEG